MQTNAIYNDTTIKPSNYVWFRNIAISEMPFIRNRTNTISFEMQLPTASGWSSAWGHRCRIRILDTTGYEVQRLYPVAARKECVNWQTTKAGTWYSFTGELTFDSIYRGRYLEILWCVQKTKTSSDDSRRFSRCSFIYNKTTGKLELLEVSDDTSAAKLRTMISKKTAPSLTDSNYLYAYESCDHSCKPSLVAKRNATNPENIDIAFTYEFKSWYSTLNGINEYSESEGIKYLLIVNDNPAQGYNLAPLPNAPSMGMGDDILVKGVKNITGITVPIANTAKIRIVMVDPFNGSIQSKLVFITSGAAPVNLHLVGDARGGIGIGREFARPVDTEESQLQIHYPAYFNKGGFNCINYVEGVNDTNTTWYNGEKVYCYIMTTTVTTTSASKNALIGTIDDPKFNTDNVFSIKSTIKNGNTWQVNQWCMGQTNEYPRARIYIARDGSNQVTVATNTNGSYSNYLTNAKINVMIYYHAAN